MSRILPQAAGEHQVGRSRRATVAAAQRSRMAVILPPVHPLARQAYARQS